jgi:hypothetical protein
MSHPHTHTKVGHGLSLLSVIYYLRVRDGRIVLRDHPGQKVSKTTISTNKPGVVAYACTSSYIGRVSRRIAV